MWWRISVCTFAAMTVKTMHRHRMNWPNVERCQPMAASKKEDPLARLGARRVGPRPQVAATEVAPLRLCNECRAGRNATPQFVFSCSWMDVGRPGCTAIERGVLWRAGAVSGSCATALIEFPVSRQAG